jgi:hypothetical protein
VFVDKYMIEVALVGLEIAAEEKPEARTPEEKSRAKSFENLKKILAKIVLPSAFVVLTETGIQIAGTVKESGMEEPISTYYFKHGTIGVYLLGIKEKPSASFTLPHTQLLGASRDAAQALSDLLFPKEALRVTPIALFRKL